MKPPHAYRSEPADRRPQGLGQALIAGITLVLLGMVGAFVIWGTFVLLLAAGRS